MLKKVLSVLLVCTLIAALSVTAMAAGSSIKVPVNNDKSYTVSGIIDTKNYQMNVEPNNWFSKFPKESKVYTIETGTEISLVGMGSWSVAALQLKDGKLVTKKEGNDWPKLLIITEKKDDGAGLRYVKGSSIKFIAEGYYIFTAADFTPMGLNYEDYAVVLHVVKSGTTSEKGKTDATTTDKTTTKATDKTTTTKATDKTTTTTKPADKNTVKIAGENRTPGEIQNFSSGDYLYTVKSGDTMYDLAKRFYGNGNLWKDLQKANQEYLSETKNGVIFVGFNLVLPAELGGVRAKV